MADWPQVLMEPLIAGNTLSLTPRVLRTPMESGPQRTTLLTKHFSANGKYSIVLQTQEERQAWSALYDASDHGTQWINGVPADTGLGVAPHRIKFMGEPSVVVEFPQGARHRVTFDWETDEQVAP